MIQSLKWRTLIVAFVFLISLIWCLPNIVENLPENWPFSKKKLSYGLDVQGGIHLVMKVDMDGVIRDRTLRIAGSLAEDLKKEGVTIKSAQVAGEKSELIQVSLASEADAAKVQDAINKKYPGILQAVAGATGDRVAFTYQESDLSQLRTRVVGQAIETIRNRIDEFGVAEPSITAQGTDRILVQLPGIADANRAKDLINRTARLEFMLVENTVAQPQLMEWVAEAEKKGNYTIESMAYGDYIDKLNDDLKAKLPEHTKILFARNENAANIETGRDVYLVRTDTGLGGEVLKDASVGFNQFNTPIVHFSMEPVGAKKFAELTAANINRQLAVVLDKVVKSAPNIRSQIPNGEGQIEMGSGRDRQNMTEEANLIAMTLRAGALPATLRQLEERTIGPTLGADSIQKGAKAAMIGTVLILLFMAALYKGFGVIADIALLFNLLITFAVLTTLGATITLPGVAGLALTVGMAVDANVIIFERIKEELRKGSPMRVAIREGYEKAFSAIIDANITTVATCLVLIYFGTGPVRGFAVNLTVGLAASMFTAVFFTRVVVEWLTTRAKINLPL